MADNVQADAGTTGEIFATDDIAGAHYPWVKLAFGADDTATKVETGVGLPVAVQNASIAVTAAALPLPTGAATSALQLPDGHAVTVDNSSLAVTAAALPLPTGAATSAAQLPDGHNVTVDNTSIAVTHAGLTALTGAIDGTEVQCDIVSSALPSGAATSALQLPDGHAVTVDNTSIAVTAAALPLPAGAATSAAQLPDGHAVTVDNASIAVTAASLPLPAGSATSALQLPDGHAVTIDNTTGGAAVNIQDGGNSITVDGAVTANLSTADNNLLTSIEEALSGTLTVTGGGGGTEYTEAAGAATDPVGTTQILIAQTSPTSEVSNGQNVAQRGTLYGAAYTQIVDSTGSFVDTFGGGTQYTEGDDDATITGTAFMWEDSGNVLRAASAANPLPVEVTSSVLPTGAATSAAQLPDGHAVTVDNTSIAVTAAGLPLPSGAATSAAQLPDGHAVTVDNASIAVTHTGLTELAGAIEGTEVQCDILTSVLPTGAATSAAQLPDGHAVTVDNTSLAVTASSLPLPSGAATSSAQLPDGHAVTIDNTTGGAAVNIQDGGNTITVDGAVTADLGANNDVTVTGNVGHGDSDTGDAVKIGAKAVAHLSNPSAVTAGQRSDTYCNIHGIPWQIGGHPNVITSTARTDAAETGERCIAAVGPGLIPVVTRVTALCDNANSVDVGMKVAFSADATLPTDADTGTSDILVDHPGIPAGGGFTIGDGSGVIGMGQDGDEIRYTCEVPTGGAVTLSVSYYTIEV